MLHLMHIFWIAGFMALALTACRKDSWNPDKQFAEQRRVQEEVIRQSEIEKSKITSKNLALIESGALVHIQPGILISELNKVMGYRFEVLATAMNPGAGSVWETRRYRVGHLIASRFGHNSKEFEICDQERVLFKLTLANDVVRTVEY